MAGGCSGWIRVPCNQAEIRATLKISFLHKEKIIQQITTFLGCDSNAEEAINFYCSIFPDAKLLSETRCGEAGPAPKGSLLTASFQLAGQECAALNGGPMFKFNEAVLLVVNCETQAAVDEYWEKLSAGGRVSGILCK